MPDEPGIENAAARWAADAAPVALAVLDAELTVHYGNPRWRRLAASTSEVNPAVRGWLPVVAPEDQERLALGLGDAIRGASSWRGSWLADPAAGRVLHGSLEPVAGHEGELGVLSVVDPTAWTHPSLGVAGRDPLTGLPTRDPFLRALERACGQPNAVAPVAVLFIDLDSLKPVNDRHGHLVGDRVLAAIGRAIETAVRSDDVAARFGGDEFVVLCRDIAMDDAQQLAERLHDAIVHASDEVDRMTASIGIAASVPPIDGLSLLDAADQAMYRAKKVGPGGTEAVVVATGARPDIRIA